MSFKDLGMFKLSCFVFLLLMVFSTVCFAKDSSFEKFVKSIKNASYYQYIFTDVSSNGKVNLVSDDKLILDKLILSKFGKEYAPIHDSTKSTKITFWQASKGRYFFRETSLGSLVKDVVYGPFVANEKGAVLFVPEESNVLHFIQLALHNSDFEFVRDVLFNDRFALKTLPDGTEFYSKKDGNLFDNVSILVTKALNNKFFEIKLSMLGNVSLTKSAIVDFFGKECETLASNSVIFKSKNGGKIVLIFDDNGKNLQEALLSH